MPGAVLALDIGGTKIAAALVRAGQVLERLEFATPREAGAATWLDAIAAATRAWRGRFGAAGAAVTGLVDEGLWSALNPATLAVPAGFPIEAELSQRLGVPAKAWNDAQAAAFGEYRRGAGQAVGATSTMVFVTISTGIGGGIVANGRLLSGLAGHFGQWRLGSDIRALPAEAAIAGRWIGDEAAADGHAADARAVFAAWRAGEPWAAGIVRASAARAAVLVLDIHLALDPELIVLGGGIGLAAGYRDLLVSEFEALAPRLQPRVTPGRLSADAGLVGAADLVSNAPPSVTERA